MVGAGGVIALLCVVRCCCCCRALGRVWLSVPFRCCVDVCMLL